MAQGEVRGWHKQKVMQSVRQQPVEVASLGREAVEFCLEEEDIILATTSQNARGLRNENP
jgi:hypothetical protein